MPRTAVVTGANETDGIGLALVADCGPVERRPLSGRTRERGRSEAVLDFPEADEGVIGAQLDVTSTSSVAAFGSWRADRLEHLDLLANNAGTGAARERITWAPITRSIPTPLTWIAFSSSAIHGHCCC